MITHGTGRVYSYGDFPHLFWDAQPDAPVDATSPVTLARLLRRGDPETIARLLPLEILREELETLVIPEHTKIFWRCVLAQFPERPNGAGRVELIVLDDDGRTRLARVISATSHGPDFTSLQGSPRCEMESTNA